MQLTHMIHWTGRVLPAQRLCALARAHGALTVVDGAQIFAQMPVSFRKLGCDYYATSLHKWLGAPVGNGMLVVRRDRIDGTWPLLAPFEPQPLGIDKFDHWNLGTYNSALQAGIAPAIRFHNEIGTDRVHARLRELTRYWIEGARRIPGFRLHTPLDNDDLAALSLFSVDRVDSKWIERELRDRHRVHVKYRQVQDLHGLRVSPHIYTRKAELDRFVAALEQVVAAAAATG
jgi:selenocysteine lyase/cysteine desulfurase